MGGRGWGLRRRICREGGSILRWGREEKAGYGMDEMGWDGIGRAWFYKFDT